MTAFDQLRDAGAPVTPDPAFAARLRSRVQAALDAPVVDAPVVDVPTLDVPIVDLPERSTTMSTETATATTTPVRRASVTPYLTVDDAVAAIQWYVGVFGAVETVRYTGDDGRIGHAEVEVGGARIMLSDEHPELDVVGPRSLGGTSVALSLAVDDVDDVWERAMAEGATGLRPPADQPYGERSATLLDPFGHRWMVQSTIATPTTAEIEAAMPGYTVTASPPTPVVELGYLTLGTGDTAAALRFYGELFGWRGEPGNAGEGYAHVANTELPLGFTPDGVDSAPVLYFRVEDLDTYADAVEALGGTVVSRATYPSGANAACRDDQGREFQLWEPAPGY